jgi:hypothetical protein
MHWPFHPLRGQKGTNGSQYHLPNQDAIGEVIFMASQPTKAKKQPKWRPDAIRTAVLALVLGLFYLMVQATVATERQQHQREIKAVQEQTQDVQKMLDQIAAERRRQLKAERP